MNIRLIAACAALPLAGCLSQAPEVEFQWNKGVTRVDAGRLEAELGELLDALKSGARLEMLHDGAGRPTGARLLGQSMGFSVDDQTVELFIEDVNRLAKESREAAGRMRTTMALEFKPDQDDEFIKLARQRGTLKNPPTGRHETVLDWSAARVVPYRYVNGLPAQETTQTIRCKVMVPLSKPVPSTQVTLGYASEGGGTNALVEAANTMLASAPRQFGHARSFSDAELNTIPAETISSSEDGRTLEFEAGHFEHEGSLTLNLDIGGGLHGECERQARAIPGLGAHLTAADGASRAVAGLAAVRLKPR